MLAHARTLAETARLGAAIDVLPEAIYLVDCATLRFLDANRAACVRTGHSRTALRRLGPQDLLGLSREELAGQYADAVAAGDRGTTTPVTRRVPDDPGAPAVLQRYALCERGHWLVVEVWRDASDRSWAERALRDAERKFRRLFQASPDAVSLARLHTGRFLEVNEGFERLTGYTRAEAIGQTGTELGLWAQPAWSEPTFGVESTLRRKDGDARTIVRWSDVVDVGGEPTVLELAHDVTEQRQADRERVVLGMGLVKAQKNEVLGTMVAGVAHDLNHALGITIGHTDLVREDLAEGDPLRPSVEAIGAASEGARRLVRQMLAFYRTGSLARQALSLGAAVDASTQLLRAALPATITLEVSCAADTPTVLAEPTQIQQVVFNLCLNAAQAFQRAARTGSTIGIRVAPYRSDDDGTDGGLPPGLYACLSVRDNGPGMTEAVRRRLFEPFFTTQSVGEGTGLGMSVVLGIVRTHGAYIRVDTRLERGSSFQIYFPAFGGPRSAPTPSDAGAGDGPEPGAHVLYIDDEPTLVAAVTRLLRKAGYRVSACMDPREALEAIRAVPDGYDLILSDCGMPGISGLQVVTSIRALSPRVPIALTSGDITDALRAEALAVGVRELIEKPFTARRLRDTVARLVKSTRR